MNRLILPSLLVLATAVTASAQDLKAYLHTRKSYGIVESVGMPALETLIGTRVFEIQGNIKGTVRSGSSTWVLLERTDGETLSVEATALPDWAADTNVMARLIVRATRANDEDEIHATLLAIAREDEILPIETAQIEAAAKAAAARRRKKTPSIKSSDPDKFKMRGEIPTSTWVVPSDEATPYYAAYVHKHNPKLSTAETYRIAKGILGFSRLYGVDAKLIVAMVVCESDFNPNERSNKGAMGLGQLMPETAQDYGIANPYDSVDNLRGTIREIRSHMDKYRNETGSDFRALVLGLAAYNAGEGAVRRHGGVPPYHETQTYVRKVINLYYDLKTNAAR